MADLVAAGMLAPAVADLLAALVRSRASLLVTGGTGAGKTTLASTLLGLVDRSSAIVVVEEVGELNPAHPHVVRLVERRANVEGAGGVGLERLVRESLRMRPDRIVLGECRGAELREVLTAYNTGPPWRPHHHACQLGGRRAGAACGPRRARGAHGQGDAPSRRRRVDAVVHVERGVSGARRVVEVAVFSRQRAAWWSAPPCPTARQVWCEGPAGNGLPNYLAALAAMRDSSTELVDAAAVSGMLRAGLSPRTRSSPWAGGSQAVMGRPRGSRHPSPWPRG